MASGLSRRSLFAVTGAAAAAHALTPSLGAAAAPPPAPAAARGLGPAASMRPRYHFSVPDNWKNDPQRPIWVDGEYHYYYLYNADYLKGGGGTSWRRATTNDHVSFRDRGVAIPKFSNANGDCWSGSLVVDEDGTAGFGRGAIVALVTQAPEGRQAQYLWYSTNGGRTFHSGGDAPVLANPGTPDFRDPKVIWDADRGRWFMANAEGKRIGFYASPDLRHWTRVGEFARDDLGLLECPDLFRMTADDGSQHWVLGVSGNAKFRGLPATYAYWTGAFNGSSFSADESEPQWLDYGFDFYGAVTYEHRDRSGRIDPTIRHALGWANFWDYPHNTPTLVTDRYNGDDMIVRDVRLVRGDEGYVLASAPTARLQDYARRTHRLGDVRVDGTVDLSLRSSAYELSCELQWGSAAEPGNVGVEVCRAEDGGRHVAAGLFFDGPFTYVNRRPTVNPTGGESQAALRIPDGRLTFRLLVDRTSVELFVGDGKVVHSHRVFPLPTDNGIRLYSHGGPTIFHDLRVIELSVDR